MRESALRDSALKEIVRRERLLFAAKIRLSRAIMGCSQSEFGDLCGLTQRAVHMLEQGRTEPKRTTVLAIENVWRVRDIIFEDGADGGFRIVVSPSVINLQDAGSDRLDSQRVARDRDPNASRYV